MNWTDDITSSKYSYTHKIKWNGAPLLPICIYVNDLDLIEKIFFVDILTIQESIKQLQSREIRVHLKTKIAKLNI